MLKKLSFVDLIGAIIRKVEENTGRRCYDKIDKDAEMPFYWIEFVGQIPEPSKTMWKERYQVFIHTFADGSNGSVPVYNAVTELQEALTQDIDLPEEYDLLLQTPTGLQRILDEEDGSKHGITGYDFVILYGFKTKL